MRAVIVGALLCVMSGGLASAAETTPEWVCLEAGGQRLVRDSPCPAWQKTLQFPESLRSDAESAAPPVNAALHSAADRLAQTAAPVAAPLPELSAAQPPTLKKILLAGAIVLSVLLLLSWAVKSLLSRLAQLFGGAEAQAQPPGRTAPSVASPPLRVEPRLPPPLLTARAARPTPPATPPLQWNAELLQALEWKRFEILCRDFWRLKGYPAELSGTGADDVVDVLIHAGADTTRPFAIVQCKAWSSDRVGVASVRELFGMLHHVGAKLALLYAVAGFTDEAREFAAGKHLKLVSGAELLQQIALLPAEQGESLLHSVTAGDYRTPTCPSCDVKMVARTDQAGDKAGLRFWGCSRFPNCHSTLPMRRDAAAA